MKKFFGCLIAVASVASTATTVKAELLYGLTNFSQIVTFDSDSRVVTSTTSVPGFGVTGVNGGLESIDVRPLTGQLYGISTENAIYTISPTTGASSLVGTVNPAGSGRLTTIDFNPTVDRIRVLQSTGTPNNFRFNQDTTSAGFGSTTVDGNVAFQAGDANFGATPDIVAAAYTNSVAGATATTLYGIDSTNDVLVTQTPANNGTLQTVGSGLGITLGNNFGFAGFDISGQTGTAYLIGAFGGPVTNGLYTVNLATGVATFQGAISGVSGTLRGLAVGAPQAVPEPSSMILGAICVGLAAYGYRRRKNANAADGEEIAPAV